MPPFHVYHSTAASPHKRTRARAHTRTHTHTYARVWNEQRDNDGTVAVSFVTNVDTSGLHVVVVNRPARTTGCRTPAAHHLCRVRKVFVCARRTLITVSSPRVYFSAKDIILF